VADAAGETLSLALVLSAQVRRRGAARLDEQDLMIMIKSIEVQCRPPEQAGARCLSVAGAYEPVPAMLPI